MPTYRTKLQGTDLAAWRTWPPTNYRPTDAVHSRVHLWRISSWIRADDVPLDIALSRWKTHSRKVGWDHCNRNWSPLLPQLDEAFSSSLSLLSSPWCDLSWWIVFIHFHIPFISLSLSLSLSLFLSLWDTRAWLDANTSRFLFILHHLSPWHRIHTRHAPSPDRHPRGCFSPQKAFLAH